MGLLEQKMLEGTTEILLKTKNLNNLTHTSFIQGYKPSPCMHRLYCRSCIKALFPICTELFNTMEDLNRRINGFGIRLMGTYICSRDGTVVMGLVVASSFANSIIYISLLYYYKYSLLWHFSLTT